MVFSLFKHHCFRCVCVCVCVRGGKLDNICDYTLHISLALLIMQNGSCYCVYRVALHAIFICTPCAQWTTQRDERSSSGHRQPQLEFVLMLLCVCTGVRGQNSARERAGLSCPNCWLRGGRQRRRRRRRGRTTRIASVQCVCASRTAGANRFRTRRAVNTI